MSARRSRQDGFTLLEVMVAITLLLIAMAGFVPFFLQGLDQSSSTRYRSTATNLARERMEQVRQLDYREIVSASELAARFGTTASVRNADFTIAYDVEVVGYDTGEMKKVTVTVGWTAPPAPSPAVVSTMIHQQYLGPRGSLLEVEPAYSDPLGTPFDLLTDGTTTATYHIAQADWGLLFTDPANSGEAPRNVYMRLQFVDDYGAAILIGDPIVDASTGAVIDRVVDGSHIGRSWDTGGNLVDVFFQYDFDPTVVPDGYWEIQAIAYNEYGEPGNVWRLRVRRENQAPAAPPDFVAIPQDDGENIVLSWAAGPERDRDHYVLQRRMVGDPDWNSAHTVDMDIPGSLFTYTDAGSIDDMTHPWGGGDPVVTNYYEYRIWAVDWSSTAKVGDASYATAQLPPLVTTTTVPSDVSTTSTTSTTLSTGTTLLYDVSIDNNSSKTYSVGIRNSANSQVYSGSVGKNSSISVTGLPPDSYHILATTAGRPDVNQTFSLPLQAGQVVLTILP